MSKSKFIFVTGGVSSSLGKGIISASLAKLLQSRGFSITIQKFDPYINIDPGTLNPYEHGECYVTDDGAETDLDLGHYERFLNVQTSQANNVTTGKIYQTVIDKERKGEFLGKTVQVIPHITNEIKRRIKLLGEDNSYDFIITEIGGTVGDIESLPYIESVRQLIWELGKLNTLLIHLTLIPYLSAAKELKTKPTQHSVKTLMESGLNADILVCRTEHEISNEIKRKLALFCNVDVESVIQSIDASTIYEVPLLMKKEKLDEVVLKKLNLKDYNHANLDSWSDFVNNLKFPNYEVKIGLIGKYVELQDSYKSILESLIHAGASNETEIEVVSIHSEYLEEGDVAKKLLGLNGLIVAPGFGERGIEGKISAIAYARVNKLPFFGICLGMQMAVIEYARNQIGLTNANSTEMQANCKEAVIDLMESQKSVVKKGGTMRLGAWDCELTKFSKSADAYQSKMISERHRHRYEFNNEFLDRIFDDKFIIAGTNPETGLVEIVENHDHPWFVGVQFHPEYKSTVSNPHPLFISFVQASLAQKGK